MEDNKYINWLKEQMENPELYYFKDNGTKIECYFKESNHKWCEFFKSNIDVVLNKEEVNESKESIM